MSGFAVSIEKCIAEEEQASVEATAMYTVFANKVKKDSRLKIDRALAMMNYKTTTAMAEEISTEGLLEYIFESMQKRARRRLANLNMIVAYITWADGKTKDLIARAVDDDSIEFPISIWKMHAILILWGYAMTVLTPIPGLIATVLAGGVIGISRRMFKSKVDKAVRGVKAKAEAVKSAKEGTLKGKELVAGLKKMQGQYGKMKKVVDGISKIELRAPENAKQLADKLDNSPEAKTTIWEKIKNLGTIIAGALKIVWECIKALPSKLKRKPKED